MKARITTAALCLASILAIAACTKAGGQRGPATAARPPAFRDQPLVSDIYTADPSAHVFGGKIYVYPSHDIATPTPDDDLGNQYAMRDYRVLSMDKVGGKVTVGPVALDVKDVPWASQQMWAPDAAYKDGTYFLYFPARDKSKDRNGLGAFRIGVATSKARWARSWPKGADPRLVLDGPGGVRG
jgi:hypothetical protein